MNPTLGSSFGTIGNEIRINGKRLVKKWDQRCLRRCKNSSRLRRARGTPKLSYMMTNPSRVIFLTCIRLIRWDLWHEKKPYGSRSFLNCPILYELTKLNLRVETIRVHFCSPSQRTISLIYKNSIPSIVGTPTSLVCGKNVPSNPSCIFAREALSPIFLITLATEVTISFTFKGLIIKPHAS